MIHRRGNTPGSKRVRARRRAAARRASHRLAARRRAVGGGPVFACAVFEAARFGRRGRRTGHRAANRGDTLRDASRSSALDGIEILAATVVETASFRRDERLTVDRPASGAGHVCLSADHGALDRLQQVALARWQATGARALHDHARETRAGEHPTGGLAVVLLQVLAHGTEAARTPWPVGVGRRSGPRDKQERDQQVETRSGRTLRHRLFSSGAPSPPSPSAQARLTNRLTDDDRNLCYRNVRGSSQAETPARSAIPAGRTTTERNTDGPCRRRAIRCVAIPPGTRFVTDNELSFTKLTRERECGGVYSLGRLLLPDRGGTSRAAGHAFREGLHQASERPVGADPRRSTPCSCARQRTAIARLT